MNEITNLYAIDQRNQVLHANILPRHFDWIQLLPGESTQT